MKNKSISIVIPVYNEEAIIPELWSRVRDVIQSEPRITQVVFVDDGSKDRTPELIKAFCHEDKRVCYIGLSRNFGHQGALAAGIDHAEGDAVILMDGDLQDRPEAVLDFIKAWDEGHDVVYAIRSSRRENLLKRWAFNSFYWMLCRLSGIRQPMHAGIFSLVDRKVLDIIRRMPEHNRYFPGLRAFAGYSQHGIPVERDARFAGQPQVGLKGLIKLAFDAIFSFSYIPIRLVSALGLIVALGAFFFLLVIAYKKFISHAAILGWPSTLGAVLFIGGLQLIVLGIIGEYIGRIYEETKKRPQYLVQEILQRETET